MIRPFEIHRLQRSVIPREKKTESEVRRGARISAIVGRAIDSLEHRCA